MSGWRCNCIFCRLLVHPVLRRLGGGGSSLSVPRERSGSGEQAVEAGSPAGEALENPVHTVQSQGSVGAVDVEALAESISSIVESRLGDVAGKVAEQVQPMLSESTRVVVERLERIEENMGRLRKEVKELLSGMENMVMEFREALNDISNPLYVQHMQHTSGGNGSGSSKSVESLISSIATLVDKAGIDTVLELIDEYEDTGLLSPDEAKVLKLVARTVHKLKESKVPDQVVSELVSKIISGDALELIGGG